jgi:hypothetical protein
MTYHELQTSERSFASEYERVRKIINTAELNRNIEQATKSFSGLEVDLVGTPMRGFGTETRRANS